MSSEVVVNARPQCNVCKAAPALYDAKTIHGPWAFMCQPCFDSIGPHKLGTGFGQRLFVKGEDL